MTGNLSPSRRPVIRRSSAPLVLVVALLALGCQDGIPPTEPDDGSLAPTFSMQQVSQEDTPDPAAIAAAVPGFAGYFLDAGVPAVYLTDPSQRPAAEQALSSWLSSRGFSASDLEVRQARHDWTELSTWHGQAWPAALNVSGAVLSDLDEGNNRLRFGGSSALAVSAITAAVAATGVPRDAFVVERVTGYELQATLRDRVRPVHGGYQLNFLNAGGVVTLSLLCTLGFNAIPEGPPHAPNASFITNSHCTGTEGDGAVAPQDYYQPLQDPDGDRLANPENFIGVEVDDPATTISADCPLALPCRWSDAARAEYAADVTFELGRIARPAAFDPVVGTLEVDPKKSTFEITDEQPFAVLGETVYKVGRTTGWTGGVVTGTCVNIIAVGGVFVRRCQATVAAGSDSGDSGSPVFTFPNRRGNAAGNKVVLAGILWGGSIEGEPEFVYSPMFNIERELGLLQTH
ncbi:MAG: hypothetical protein ACRELV_12870 [Longimicrobiales bacterium]